MNNYQGWAVVFSLLVPGQVVGQALGEYDMGFKSLRWGTSIAEAQSLIEGSPARNGPIVDWTEETMKLLGHSSKHLRYYEITDEVAFEVEYMFIDDHFYRIRKQLYKGDSDIQKAYIDAMADKLDTQYGTGKRKGFSIQWECMYVGIRLSYSHSDNLFPVYWDTVIEIFSKEYEALRRGILKEVELFKKKKAAEKARKIID